MKLSPPVLRDSELAAMCEILRLEKSADGKILKFVFATVGKAGSFETGSFLHKDMEGARHDICVSTMAGCPLECTMCAIPYSASSYDRSLTAEEIEEQVHHAVKERGTDGRTVRHVVGFMGNGEPFLNTNALVRAAERLLTDPLICPSSFTVSTTGIRPEEIRKLAKTAFGKSGIGKIQFSLMSMDPSRRHSLIPAGGSLQKCIGELDAYARQTGNAVKYNIALIDGMNDSDEEAEALASFINEAPEIRRAKISTFNVFPGVQMQPSPPEKIARFVGILSERGIRVKRFYGDIDPEIFSSCGQLRADIDRVLKK